MKVRIKFRKYGVMRFIGHLDVMRYFQKAIRRAELDITYSTGFSPHQIMSFAAPLGVGMYSNIDMISSLCILMARGALISMVVVIFVLPSMFMVFDKVIVKTSKGFLPPKE